MGSRESHNTQTSSNRVSRVCPADTHAVTGGIIGFAWAYKGFRAVNWMTYDPTMFPPYRGR